MSCKSRSGLLGAGWMTLIGKQKINAFSTHADGGVYSFLVSLCIFNKPASQLYVAGLPSLLITALMSHLHSGKN